MIVLFLGDSVSILLYNSSIKTRISNQQIVNPVEELEIMRDQYKLSANRVSICSVN